MNAFFRSFASLAAMLVCGFVAAAPREVETFDARAWAALQGSLKAPAAVVFTTTDCVYCPGVLQRLSDEIRTRKLDATLIAVVMDVGPGEDDARLLNDPHHRHVDRLLAFSGPPAALRHTVNPSWRGVTPYIAFLARSAPPKWVTGLPSKQAVDDWAAAMAR